MDNKMFDIRVFTEKESDCIYIEQSSNGVQRNDDQIAVHPDQVDILIKWLQKAKDELMNKNSNDEE